MRILVDENIPRMTVDRLRQIGHDVKDVRGTADEGTPDSQLWELARSEGRLLITTDKGFTQHRGIRHDGVLIVRLRQPNRRKNPQSVMQAIARFEPADWMGLLVVVRDTTQSIARFER